MKSIIFTLLIFTVWIESSAQGICEGNLGENIFERGDFGSGLAPILATNPNIAPGYTYTTNVPSDGSYTVCSNTGALAGLYPTWIAVGDNSDDPNGYMMVVNASFSPGIFYEETVEGLCENTLYEFSADILNLIKIGTANHIDPNVSFLIDNQLVYSTGDVPKTERWRQYGFSFVTSSTQSTITLTLRNNAPGGGGNDLALDNISFRPCGPSSFIGIESDTTIFLCIDDEPLIVVADVQAAAGQDFAVQWQSSLDGIEWQILDDSTSNTVTHTNFNPGDYYYRYFSAGNEVNIQNEKCRIISDVIKLTILPDTYTVTDTLCEGLTYEFGNQELTISGPYEESFESQYGCDSIVLLDLVFIPPLNINLDLIMSDPSCNGFDDGIIIVDSISGGNGDLLFMIYDEEGSVLSSSIPSGNYTIEVVDRFLCTEDFDVVLNDPPPISVSLGADTTILLGDELTLSADFSSDFVSLLWEGMGEFSCVDCESPEFLPYFNGVVALTAIDENGCEAKDSLQVNVDDQSFLILPNIFSPNDDGINDFFTINFYGRSVSSINSFNVYDRWGGKVFNVENIATASGEAIWDGYSNNQKVENGVYSYIIKVLLVNGNTIDRVGSLTVLK